MYVLVWTVDRAKITIGGLKPGVCHFYDVIYDIYDVFYDIYDIYDVFYDV